MATLTITIPTASALRIAEAVGYFKTERGETPTPATMADVKAFVIQNLKDAVISYEREEAVKAARIAAEEMNDIT